MFYYPNVLQRHTGCFATIWLAATRGSRLLKREYLKVNVVKTCEEILSYVLVQVPPAMPGLPRPRFSLYLSAQLQIGVIRVYSQQCQYLVEDIQHILERLHRAQLQIRIDMVEPDLNNLLPDCLTMMETLEAAPDPFFGMMSVDLLLPSPLNIPQIRHLLEAATPERPLAESPPVVTVEPSPGTIVPLPSDKPQVLVKSPQAITIQEDEPIRILQIEGEQDLPEVSRRDLDLLMAEEDEALLLEEHRRRGLPEPRSASPAREESKEEPRALEEEPTVPRLSPSAPAQMEGTAEPPAALGPVLEKVKPAGWEPGTPLPEVTPPQKLRLPSPVSPERRRPPISPSPEIPPAPRRRRRRQLLFWDAETQISREKFQGQLQTKAHCWEECPLVQPSEKTIRSPTELFSTPTYPGQLPPQLLAFWTRCAQPPPRALRRRPALEPDEEAVEEERRKMDTPSEIEVLREAQEPSGPLMLSSGKLLGKGDVETIPVPHQCPATLAPQLFAVLRGSFNIREAWNDLPQFSHWLLLPSHCMALTPTVTTGTPWSPVCRAKQMPIRASLSPAQKCPWKLKRTSPGSACPRWRSAGPGPRWSSRNPPLCLWCPSSRKCPWSCHWTPSCSRLRLCTGLWHWSYRPTGNLTSIAWWRLLAHAG